MARRPQTFGLWLIAACGPEVASTSMSASGGGSSESESSGAVETSASATSIDPTNVDATSSGELETSSTGPSPDTCPEVVQDAECPAQGESCTQRDFACECVCFCEGPRPGLPGGWECEYAYRESLLALADSQITIDCDGPAIAAEFSFVISNEGHSTIEVALERNFGLFLTVEGIEEQPCGGLCLDCGRTDPIAIEPGSSGNAALTIPPTMCGQEATTEMLCSFCGGTASTTIYWSLETEGKSDWEGVTFEGLPIVCE